MRSAGIDARNGALGKIRTPDPQIRSLVLYPAELRAHQGALGACKIAAPKAPDVTEIDLLMQVALQRI